MGWTDQAARACLRAMFDAAIASADPHIVLARHLPTRPTHGRTIVVGAGKSAASMAAALEAAWLPFDEPSVEGPPLDGPPLEGVVVTRYGHAVPTTRIQVIESSHPVPDANSERGARALLAAVANLAPNDLVIALMSGGASALIELPAPGLTLSHLQSVNTALLQCGAPIHEMNAVRKHLSAIKGGRLAQAAAPARVITLAISDVPNDDPATIGSGPTVPDPSTWADVHAIAARYNLDLPLTQGPETPKHLETDLRMIATPAMALHAAAAAARTHGLTPLILGDAIEGRADQVATVMAGIAKSAARHGHPAPAPCVLLSGGETTVQLPPGHTGQGGRNTEFLLALATALQGHPNIYALAGDTDGIDGNQNAAGAIITPDTLTRAHHLNPNARLAAHESYALFHALNDLIITGPTLTNVNDFRAILIA